MTGIFAAVRRETNALPRNAARLHRIAGIAVATSTILLTLALFGFHASSDPLEAKRAVLSVLFVMWCASAMAVMASYAISGIIISTLGLHFSHLQVIRRNQTPIAFWAWWGLFAVLLVLIAALFQLAIRFVTFPG